jgi:hypothetical protein
VRTADTPVIFVTAIDSEAEETRDWIRDNPELERAIATIAALDGGQF